MQAARIALATRQERRLLFVTDIGDPGSKMLGIDTRTGSCAACGIIGGVTNENKALRDFPWCGGLFISCSQRSIARHDSVSRLRIGGSNDLVGQEADQLVASLCAAPEVAVMSHSDSSAVMNALQRALEDSVFLLTVAPTAGSPAQ